MPWVRSLLTLTLTLTMALVTSTVAAADEPVAAVGVEDDSPADESGLGGPQVNLHGSGVWNYGITDHNRYRSATPTGGYDRFTFNFHADAEVTSQLRAIVSLFAESGGEEEPGVTLDYAYAEWTFNRHAKLHVGKPKHPFGLYALIWDIGTLRPFIMLPQAVYGTSGFIAESYLGAGLTGSFGGSGGWALTYDLYGGQLQLAGEEPFALLGGDMGGMDMGAAPGVVSEPTVRNAVGAKLVLATPVMGLSLGASGYAGETEMHDGLHRVFGAQLEYQGLDWVLRAEAIYHNAGGDLTSYAGYVETSYMLGEHWQVAALADWLKVEFTNDPDDPLTEPLERHFEYAVGLNYWFSVNMQVKVAAHTIDGNRFAHPAEDKLDEVVMGDDLRHRTNLVTLGAAFTY